MLEHGDLTHRLVVDDGAPVVLDGGEETSEVRRLERELAEDLQDGETSERCWLVAVCSGDREGDGGWFGHGVIQTSRMVAARTRTQRAAMAMPTMPREAPESQVQARRWQSGQTVGVTGGARKSHPRNQSAGSPSSRPSGGRS